MALPLCVSLCNITMVAELTHFFVTHFVPTNISRWTSMKVSCIYPSQRSYLIFPWPEEGLDLSSHINCCRYCIGTGYSMDVCGETIRAEMGMFLGPHLLADNLMPFSDGSCILHCLH